MVEEEGAGGLGQRVPHHSALLPQQGPRAEAMMRSSIERGKWVFFQNCHLAPSWMPVLERLIEHINPDKVHQGGTSTFILDGQHSTSSPHSGHSASDTCNMHQLDYSSQRPLKLLPPVTCPRPPSTEVTLGLAEAHVPNQWSVPGIESGRGWPRILGRGEPGPGVAAVWVSGLIGAWPPGAPGLPPVAHQPA